MSSSDDDDSLPSSSASPQAAQEDPLLPGNRPTQTSQSEGLESNPSRIISSPPAPPPPTLRAGQSVGVGNDPNEDDEDQNDSEEERPNRYHGPASTWRSWTEAERSLAGSLNQLRASDLSLHLYNAHALKARLRKQNPSAPIWASKKRWLNSDDEENTSEKEGGHEDQDNRFLPPKGWTAWPLPATIVPRDGERVGYSTSHDEMWEIENSQVGKPSDFLEEVLVGAVTKRAKEKFNQRTLEAESLPKPGLKPENIDHSQHSSPLPQGSPEPGTQEVHNHTNYAIRPKPGLDPKPVVMADDQEAHRILRPTVRHILTKLDDILMGLHQARQAYAHPAGTTDSESEINSDIERSSTAKRKPGRKAQSTSRQSDISESSSSGDEGSSSARVLGRRKVKHRTNSMSTRSRRGSESSTASSSERSASTSPQPKPNKRRRSASPTTRVLRRQAAFGLRDWSDILGIASLVGWEPEVVQRAAARCSSLFGERMSFRTLEESNALKAENGRDKVTEYQEEVSEAVNTRQLCPVAECGRSQRPFGRRDNLLRHLRIVHGLDKQEVAEESKADESMVGGVHNNGFLKQIPVRRGWRGRDVEQRARPTLEQLRRKRMDS